MHQLQRISDGVVFDVLGTKTEPSFVDAVFLTYAEGSLAGRMFGFGRAVLESEFIAYPPQEKPVAGGPLMRRDIHGGEHLFDVMHVVVHGGGMWLQGRHEKSKPVWMERSYVQKFFTAYPPQEQPDRVDRLAQETDGWEPLKAYTVAFCPADDKPLEPGHRVVEAYAGALVDARKCPTCGRFFEDNYLAEIKLWKD
jgi:hypothetical protein